MKDITISIPEINSFAVLVIAAIVEGQSTDACIVYKSGYTKLTSFTGAVDEQLRSIEQVKSDITKRVRPEQRKNYDL